MLRMLAVLLLFACAASAGTVAQASCNGIGNKLIVDTETSTAACHYGGSFGSYSSYAYATASSAYGNLSASASSSWASGGCLVFDCQPDSGASAEFVQYATFSGLSGTGYLVFRNAQISPSDMTVNTRAFLSGFVYQGPTGMAVPADYWKSKSYTGFPYFPITFGTPFAIDGYVSISASDNESFILPSPYLTLGSFYVLDSNGNQLQSWTSIANLPVATYSLVDGSFTATGDTPEPSTVLLAALGLVGLTAGRRAYRSFSLHLTSPAYLR